MASVAWQQQRVILASEQTDPDVLCMLESDVLKEFQINFPEVSVDILERDDLKDRVFLQWVRYCLINKKIDERQVERFSKDIDTWYRKVIPNLISRLLPLPNEILHKTFLDLPLKIS